MTSPTQSAMEQQQREALSACLEILQVIRPDYFRAVHGNQNGCDFDFEVCEQCEAAGDPPAHANGCFSEKLDAAIRSADDVLAVSLDQASELRSLRDSLALARSHIGELREALEQIVAIEDREWKPMQCFRSDEQVAKDEARHDLAGEIADIARAALNKEQPCEEVSVEWTHPCKGFGGKLLQVPLGEQCDRCGESAEQP